MYSESIGRAPVWVASVFWILFHMFSHFVLRRKYLPDDSNKIQALFSFSVSDFETWLGFKIRSRAIGKKLRLPSEPLLNNFSIGKWLFDLQFKIWCKRWGGWDQFHSQTNIILVDTKKNSKAIKKSCKFWCQLFKKVLAWQLYHNKTALIIIKI